MIGSIASQFFVGFLLGSAQYMSRLFFISSNQHQSLVLGASTLFLYLMASLQWIKILKSDLDLTSAYAVVVLGVFVGITLANLILSTNKLSITYQDCFGIFLIFVGCSLVKH